MICPCGGILTSYQTKQGLVYKCKACGRREVVERK